MNPVVFSWLVYAGWAMLVVYLVVVGRNAKRDADPDLGQSLGLMYALIAAFALPYVPLFSFVNYAPVDTRLSIVGLLVFLVGIVFFIAARHQLGRNWSQTVSAKQEHELLQPARTTTCATRCTAAASSPALVPQSWSAVRSCSCWSR